MAGQKQKACKNCKMIVDGDKCENCDSTEFAENFKGKINVLKPEESEIAKNLKITKKGSFAVKT